eukprot:1899749-Lingulodinium_polyedra.AAC.1
MEHFQLRAERLKPEHLFEERDASSRNFEDAFFNVCPQRTPQPTNQKRNGPSPARSPRCRYG